MQGTSQLYEVYNITRVKTEKLIHHWNARMEDCSKKFWKSLNCVRTSIPVNTAVFKSCIEVLELFSSCAEILLKLNSCSNTMNEIQSSLPISYN